jgi:hypothetical protein
MTRAWVVRWTVIITACLAAIVLPVSFGQRPSFPAFMAGVLGLFVSGLVVADKAGPPSRYLPPAVAVAIGAVWSLYRAVMIGDLRTGSLFLGLVGFAAVVTLFGMAQQAVRKRGWVVETPLRRWIGLLLPVVFVVRNLLEERWPVMDSPWVAYGIVTAMFAVWFWPSRMVPRRAAHPPP